MYKVNERSDDSNRALLRYQLTTEANSAPRRQKSEVEIYELRVNDEYIINPNEIIEVDLGVILDIKSGYCGRIFVKSDAAHFRKLFIENGIVRSNFRKNVVIRIGSLEKKEKVKIDKGEWILKVIMMTALKGTFCQEMN